MGLPVAPGTHEKILTMFNDFENWQSTLHTSGGGSGGVVGRGAFSEDKGLGSDDSDGGNSGTPPGC